MVVPQWTGKTHWAHTADVVPGDNVAVKWGRYGTVLGRVVSVQADGLRVVRWNKSAHAWTEPRRYYTRTTKGGTVRLNAGGRINVQPVTFWDTDKE